MSSWTYIDLNDNEANNFQGYGRQLIQTCKSVHYIGVPSHYSLIGNEKTNVLTNRARVFHTIRQEGGNVKLFIAE